MNIQEYLQSIGRIKNQKPEPIETASFSQITPQPENWTQAISELESYFSEMTLPNQPIKLNTYSTITNVSLFIDSHIATVKANNGNNTFLPDLNRLQELKELTF